MHNVPGCLYDDAAKWGCSVKAFGPPFEVNADLSPHQATSAFSGLVSSESRALKAAGKGRVVSRNSVTNALKRLSQKAVWRRDLSWFEAVTTTALTTMSLGYAFAASVWMSCPTAPRQERHCMLAELYSQLNSGAGHQSLVSTQ